MGSAKRRLVNANANAAQSNSAFTVRDLGSIDGIIKGPGYCGGIISEEHLQPTQVYMEFQTFSCLWRRYSPGQKVMSTVNASSEGPSPPLS